jgi:hypothetical protein
MDVALISGRPASCHGDGSAFVSGMFRSPDRLALMGLMMLASQFVRSHTRKTGVLDHTVQNTVLGVSASEYEVRSAALLLYTKDGGTLTRSDRNNQVSLDQVSLGT